MSAVSPIPNNLDETHAQNYLSVHFIALYVFVGVLFISIFAYTIMKTCFPPTAPPDPVFPPFGFPGQNAQANENPGDVEMVPLQVTVPGFTYHGTPLPHGTEECSICFGPFLEDEQVMTLRPCNHSFHSECIAPWFQRSSVCPFCRGLVEG